MCGIIAIVRSPNNDPAVDVASVLESIEGLDALLSSSTSQWPAPLETAADPLRRVNDELLGAPGVAGLRAAPPATEDPRARGRARGSAAGQLADVLRLVREGGDAPANQATGHPENRNEGDEESDTGQQWGPAAFEPAADERLLLIAARKRADEHLRTWDFDGQIPDHAENCIFEFLALDMKYFDEFVEEYFKKNFKS